MLTNREKERLVNDYGKVTNLRTHWVDYRIKGTPYT